MFFSLKTMAAVLEAPAKLDKISKEKIKNAFITAFCDAGFTRHLSLIAPLLNQAVEKFSRTDLIENPDNIYSFFEDADRFDLFVAYMRVELCRLSKEVVVLTHSNEILWDKVIFKPDFGELIKPVNEKRDSIANFLHIDAKLLDAVRKTIKKRMGMFYLEPNQKWRAILEVTLEKLEELSVYPKLQKLNQNLSAAEKDLICSALHSNRFDIVPKLSTGFLWFHLDPTWQDPDDLKALSHSLAEYVAMLIYYVTVDSGSEGIYLREKEVDQIAETLFLVGQAFNQQFLEEHYRPQLVGFFQQVLQQCRNAKGAYDFNGTPEFHVRNLLTAFETNRIHLYSIYENLSNLKNEDIQGLNINRVERENTYPFLDVFFKTVYGDIPNLNIIKNKLPKCRQILESALGALNAGSSYFNSGHDVPLNFVAKIFLSAIYHYGYASPATTLQDNVELDAAIGAFVKNTLYKVNATLLKKEVISLSHNWNFLVFQPFKNQQMPAFLEKLKRLYAPR